MEKRVETGSHNFVVPIRYVANEQLIDGSVEDACLRQMSRPPRNRNGRVIRAGQNEVVICGKFDVVNAFRVDWTL
jgi:hypothetical protein